MSPRTLLVVVLVALLGGGVAYWLSRAPEASETVVNDAERPDVPPSVPDEANPRPSTPGQGPTPTEAERATGRVVARFDWGGGPNQLGRNTPDEANPEAPMSFAPGPNGSTYVLDQVNGRVLRMGPDGEVLGTTNLDQVAPQDLAVAADGTVAVLDRLADRNVAVISPEGEVLGRLPLEGDLLEEAGGVTAVIVDGEDVYAEREHGPLVHIGDVHGTPASARHEIPGRPSRDGSLYLLAALVDQMAGRLIVNAIDRDSGEHRFTRQLQALMAIREILLLDTDGQGVVYLAIAGAPNPEHMEFEEVHLVCLSATDGHTIGTAILPGNMDADETMRQLAVQPGGGVLYGVRNESGMAFQQYDCR